MKFASRRLVLPAAALVALAGWTAGSGCRRRAARPAPARTAAATPAAAAPAETLQGVVADGRGRPVPGARVVVLPGGPAREPPRDAVTDADGRFAVGRLARGPYRLLVEAAGFVSSDVAAVEVPGP